MVISEGSSLAKKDENFLSFTSMCSARSMVPGSFISKRFSSSGRCVVVVVVDAVWVVGVAMVTPSSCSVSEAVSICRSR